MREAELKHARIAMLAVVGSIAQEVGFVFPGLVSDKAQVRFFSSSTYALIKSLLSAYRKEPSRCVLEVP